MTKLLIRKAKKEDCDQLLELIRELAIFERAEEEVSISVSELMEDGFGSNSIYEAFVAEYQDKLVGMALYYEKYSTWKGRSLYLEDLIVKAEMRGKGFGKALFESVIEEATRRGSGRMEWQVLDWNKPAIDFYKNYGANLDDEWLNARFSKQILDSIQIKKG